MNYVKLPEITWKNIEIMFSQKDETGMGHLNRVWENKMLNVK